MTRRLFLATVGAVAAAPAAPWDKRPFPDWSSETVDRLLTDSPWAHPETVSFEYAGPPPAELRSTFEPSGPVGPSSGPLGLPSGIPGVGWPGRRNPRPSGGPTIPAPGGEPTSVRVEAYLTVRWSSALPIRQALAIERWGRGGLEMPEAAEALAAEPDHYLVEIFGLPAMIAPEGVKRIEEDLRRTARLTLSGRSVSPTAVRVPEYGMHLTAKLAFPRWEGVEPGDGAIGFRAEPRPLEIATKFKLDQMVYEGRLAL